MTKGLFPLIDLKNLMEEDVMNRFYGAVLGNLVGIKRITSSYPIIKTPIFQSFL